LQLFDQDVLALFQPINLGLALLQHEGDVKKACLVQDCLLGEMWVALCCLTHDRGLEV